jgi:2-keto-3-deoxy-L-rhamnonate aldolase RhmA
MAMTLMYITNKTEVARIAEQSGVDWIFVDLEFHGKSERQVGRNTVISKHTIDDVKKIRSVLSRSQLLVRVNPIWTDSKHEIDTVIAAGADIIMLPYFKTLEEVETFISCVNGRGKTCLLLETPEAVTLISEIVKIQGIDFIHIGLNDLAIAHGMKFIYELLADGTIDKLAKEITKCNIAFGFGGIARVGKKKPPAEDVIAEHYRLGSSMVILARSFCDSSVNDIVMIEHTFRSGVADIRVVEQKLLSLPSSFFEQNRLSVQADILKVVEQGEKE